MKAAMLLAQHRKYIAFHILIIFILLTFFLQNYNFSLRERARNTLQKSQPLSLELKCYYFLQNKNQSLNRNL